MQLSSIVESLASYRSIYFTTVEQMFNANSNQIFLLLFEIFFFLWWWLMVLKRINIQCFQFKRWFQSVNSGWTGVEPYFYRRRRIVGPWLDCGWKLCLDRGLSNVEPCLDHGWTIIEPWLDCGWKPCLDRGLTDVEPCLDHGWTIIEPLLDFGWKPCSDRGLTDVEPCLYHECFMYYYFYIFKSIIVQNWKSKISTLKLQLCFQCLIKNKRKFSTLPPLLQIIPPPPTNLTKIH